MSDDGAAQKTTAPQARSPSPHFTKEEKKMTENNRLRLAMQKSGRLSDDSQDLLERCGLKVRFHSQRLLAVAENMPVEILRVRDDDIPGLVMDGVVTPSSLKTCSKKPYSPAEVKEKNRNSTCSSGSISAAAGCRWRFRRMRLGAVWKASTAAASAISSYPRASKRCFDERGLTFKPCLLTGSVEVAPRVDLAKHHQISSQRE